ncbi:MAG: hypothetical protein ACXW6J_09645 [Candidatus Binatia bacterium]
MTNGGGISRFLLIFSDLAARTAETPLCRDRLCAAHNSPALGIRVTDNLPKKVLSCAAFSFEHFKAAQPYCIIAIFVVTVASINSNFL